MENNNEDALKVDTPRARIEALAARMEAAEHVTPEDAAEFKKLVVACPDVWASVMVSARCVQTQLIQKICKGGNGASEAYFETETAVLKQQFAYGTATSLERMLIEQILTARLRVMHAEWVYTSQIVGKEATYREAEYRDRLVGSANSRLRNAIEALARVQRLTRNTPTLQINIANDGGKQVNLQGEPKAAGVGNQAGSGV